MNPNDERTAGIVVGFMLAAILFAGVLHVLSVSPAHGQAVAEIDLETQLVIAQAAVAECGWMLPDCDAAVWHTLKRRAGFSQGRRSIGDTVREYCAAWDPSNRLDQRSIWVRNLPAPSPEGFGPSAGLPAPRGWPALSSWDKHRARWLRVVGRAGAFLRGEISDPCKGGRAVHFGGAMDIGAASWVPLECGDTGGQIFYAFGGAK